MIWINLKKKIDEEENKRKNNWYGSLIDQLIIFLSLYKMTGKISEKKIRKSFQTNTIIFFIDQCVVMGRNHRNQKLKKNIQKAV